MQHIYTNEKIEIVHTMCAQFFHYFPIQNITNSLERNIYKGLRKYDAFEVQIGYKNYASITRLT
jgi:hypothetical protein